MRRLAALAALLAFALPACAVAADVPLAAHKALYALTLQRARGDVVAAHGTMGYEVLDACDGWAVRQRLDMKITNAEGQTVDMVSDYATWEAKNGRRLRFHMKQTTDEAVTSQTDGSASVAPNGGPGVVHYTQPRRDSVPLPRGTLFPMAHTATIIEAAREGRRFLNLPLFDGTSDTGAEDSSVVITHRYKPHPTKWPALSKLASSRVHVAFYDWDSTGMLPDFQIGMRYWDNGVADDMTMDFGEFVMHAKMLDFAPQPRHC